MLIMWSPPPPTVEEAVQLYSPGQVTSVYVSPDLPKMVHETLKTYPDAILHVLPPYPFAPFPEQPKDFAEPYGGSATHAYLLQALHQARLIKTPQEIALIRKANEISSRAHEVTVFMGLYGEPSFLYI